MTTGTLTDDLYECGSCFDGAHDCTDLFHLEPFGTLACCCQRCSPWPVS